MGRGVLCTASALRRSSLNGCRTGRCPKTARISSRRSMYLSGWSHRSRVALGSLPLGSVRIQAWALLRGRRTWFRTRFIWYVSDGCSVWWSAWWRTTDPIWCAYPATPNWSLLGLIVSPFRNRRGICPRKCSLPPRSVRMTPLLILSHPHLLVA